MILGLSSVFEKYLLIFLINICVRNALGFSNYLFFNDFLSME